MVVACSSSFVNQSIEQSIKIHQIINPEAFELNKPIKLEIYPMGLSRKCM